MDLSRDEARELDRRAIEECGIPGAVLMENAGRSMAALLWVLGIEGKVVICCGPGEYVFVGGPMSVTFTPNAPGSGTVQLASFDESMCVDGRWVSGRRLNGDETGHNSRWPVMRTFGIYRYRIYQRD